MFSTIFGRSHFSILHSRFHPPPTIDFIRRPPAAHSHRRSRRCPHHSHIRSGSHPPISHRRSFSILHCCLSPYISGGFALSDFGFLVENEQHNKDAFNVADLDAALNAEGRADLVNVLKNKLQDLAGKHSDVLENLSPGVKKRVDVLRKIQVQHDDLEAKFFEERAALEAKYQKLYQPLYVKRYEIVNGVDVGGATNDAEATKQVDNEGEEKGFLISG